MTIASINERPNYTEKQTWAMSYCVNRGKTIEKRMKRIQEEKKNNLLDFDAQEKLKKTEETLTKEASALRRDYREAKEARRNYEYHCAEARKLREKWGF